MPSHRRRNYYTYMYADPAIPWDGSTEAQLKRYGRHSPEIRSGFARPLYVGKGKGRRMYDHQRDKDGTSRPDAYDGMFYRYLRKMRRENREPVIVMIAGTLTEQEALDEEVRSILEIGRKKLGTGPLLNMTDGGDGSSGWDPPKSWRETRSKAISGSNNPCFGKKGPEHPRFGGKHTDEHKARMREISRERMNDPALRARMRKRMSGDSNPTKRPEVRETMREAGKKRTERAHQHALLLTQLVFAARADGHVTCDEIRDYLNKRGVRGARGGPLARSTIWYVMRHIDEDLRQPHKEPTGGKRNKYHLEKSKARISNTSKEKMRKYLESCGDTLLTALQEEGGNYAAAARLLAKRKMLTFQNRGEWTNYRLKAMLTKHGAMTPEPLKVDFSEAAVLDPASEADRKERQSVRRRAPRGRAAGPKKRRPR